MNSHDWESVIQRHLDGAALPEEVAGLSEQLESDADTRMLYIQMARIHATLAADDLDESDSDSFLRESTVFITKRPATLARWRLAVAALAVVALIAGVYFLRPSGEPEIATITELDGSVQWTGDGGQVTVDLEPGQRLHGGTLESLSVNSSAGLQFRDGSTVTVSGVSLLTISARDQKEFYLRHGNLSATVAPQPTGKPLIVHTPAAELEVLGTQFDVTADSSQTKVTVNEGRVRVERLTDGRVVEVPAAHQTVASIEVQQEFVVTALEKPTNSWKANLANEADEGRWISAMHALRLEVGRAVDNGEMTADEARQEFLARAANLREDEGSLHAAPVRSGRGARRDVSYMASLLVSREQSGPVVLAKGNKFRVRGRVRSPAGVTIGFSALDADRASGGRYLTRKRLEGEFDIELPLDAFQLLGDRSGATSPLGRELIHWWCSTDSREAVLEITSVRLLEPE